MSTTTEPNSAEKEIEQAASGDLKRSIFMTEKGVEQFEASCNTHLKKIKKVWCAIQDTIKEIEDSKSSRVEDLLNLHEETKRHVAEVESLSTSYLDFLNRCHSDQSNKEMERFSATLRGYRISIDSAMRKLALSIQDQQIKDSMSHVSTTSTSSRNSLSSIATKKRAKAKALKASLKFAEEQAKLERKQAELTLQHAITEKESAYINTEMTLLNLKKETLELETEASVLEEGEDGDSMKSALRSLEQEATEDRTTAYVENISPASGSNQPEPTFQEPSLNVRAPPFEPRVAKTQHPHVSPETETPSTSVTSDFTRYLLKKDLLLSRLTNFNDKPEFYPTWKNSFKAIMQELQASPIEEMDLLVKWTGPLSQRHVLSIKAANPNNPRQAVIRSWSRLDERYGCPEMMEAALKSKLDSFPMLTNKDVSRLYDLSDILDEIEAAKEDTRYSCLLSYFDCSTGITPIVKKLPNDLQGKWTSVAVKYMAVNDVPFPPFKVFAEFIREQSRIKNNPSFSYGVDTRGDRQVRNQRDRVLNVSSRKTEVAQPRRENSSDRKCPLHNTFHTLNKCKGFKQKSLEERRKFLKENNICFRCCDSRSHKMRDCRAAVKCEDCDSSTHPTALHVETQSRRHYGGESQNSLDVNSACTQICRKQFGGKSCSKTVLVRVYPQGEPQLAVNMYAVIDDQSNRSLASPRFFTYFECGSEAITYTLSSCGGTIQTFGRKAEGFVAEAYGGGCVLNLPALIECQQVPCARDEIPTPEVALHYSHLADIAKLIPPLDPDADILLLLGRDLIEAHHVLDQRIGQGNQPYGQKLHLGWTIIGETCLGKTHAPTQVTTYKTHLLGSGRVSLLPPCTNEFKIRENLNYVTYGMETGKPPSLYDNEDFGRNVFQRTQDDEKPGMSVDDLTFLKIMDQEFQKSENGHWTAPLPFRQPHSKLPNNRDSALKRAKALEASLRRDAVKKEHFLTFMDGLIKNRHAEIAPPLTQTDECWYLPIFGIYHPKKPNQLRAVFDSSAKYGGISLNDVLLTGPDLTNSLLGVLMRFRQEAVAIMGDIQQMFYCFKVREDHRNFLRFFWFRDNDPDQPLTEYRMTVHVFGNRPSPAVATYGLRRAALMAESTFGKDVTDFVVNNFYVDDGLVSVPAPSEAIDLMKRTQRALMSEGGLRLHKIASNQSEVLSAFPPEDLAKDMKDLEFGIDLLPSQRSLGLNWNLETDAFFFEVMMQDKPFTRRGVLSCINSIFDPLGFAAPVIIEGKSILRNLVLGTIHWDDPLPLDQLNTWTQWRDSLSHLENLHISRNYSPESLQLCKDKSIHVFCDASELAIAAVGYMKITSSDNESHLGFVLGKAKLAPTHGHSIPRLELCAAVLAVEIACSIADHLSLPIQDFKFYSDSKVVLGYIFNTTRRFYTYVANRISYIRKFTKPEQWAFVPTEDNPADAATRPLPTHQLKDSSWLKGPTYLLKQGKGKEQDFDIVNPESDKEIRPIICMKTISSVQLLGSHRFSKFSNWTILIRTFAFLQHIIRSFCGHNECKGWHYCTKSRTVEAYQESEKLIIKTVQQEAYREEIDYLKQGKALPCTSSLLCLGVFLDSDDILRVGGRLNRSNILPQAEINPIVIPGKHHIATLLTRHFHDLAQHQGRHITAGTIRNAGYWITGSKRLISSIIYNCVKCRKLRGKFAYQKMANLPPDRLEPGPPFTYVGLDTFGPWEVVTRKTRGGAANAKRWAILFTCMVSRGIHIEVVEEMSSSSFINAFKRFVAIRGKVKQIRSDRGTNFVGATDDLHINAVNVEDGPVKEYLYKSGVVWLFNPPHSSHFGGVWERLIGVTRRVLDSMLLEIPPGSLTHEILTTFLAEASAIVNSRPLVPVSTDPEDPLPLSPSLILTHKPDNTVDYIPTDGKDLLRSQWRRVQHLADTFWKRWRTQYLQTLQNYRKWKQEKRNLVIGDVILLKDNSVTRNSWPLGRVVRVFPSTDGRVRKAEICVVYRDGHSTTFVRPVTELVVLIQNE